MALYAIGDLHYPKQQQVHGGVRPRVGELYRADPGVPEPTDGGCAGAGRETPPGNEHNEIVEDFGFWSILPAYLIKGNHDYWWATIAKFRTFCRPMSHHPGTVAQQLLFLQQSRIIPLRHPGVVPGGGPEASQRQGLEPGGGTAGGIPPGGGGAAHLLLPPLSAPVPGLSVPGDPGGAGAVPGGAVLLRPPPRAHHQAKDGGAAGADGVLPDLRGPSGVCS